MSEKETYTQLSIEGAQYGVPPIVEENIQKQASKAASKASRPDLAEDLEQEARVCAWQEARNGESNPQHLLANTRQAISGVMRSGTAVGGRPWPAYERETVYEVWSLDYVVEEEHQTTHGETLVDERMDVEEQALGRVMVWHLHRLLDAEDGRLLAWKLEGRYHKEIAVEEGMSEWKIKQGMKRVRERAAGYLGRGDLV